MPPDLATDTPSDVAGGAGPSDLSQFASSVLPSTDTRGADLEAQRRGASERERSTAEAVAARATSGGAALNTYLKK